MFKHEFFFWGGEGGLQMKKRNVLMFNKNGENEFVSFVVCEHKITASNI